MQESILSLNPFYLQPRVKKEYFEVLFKFNINSEIVLYIEVKYGRKNFFKSER